MAVMIPSVISPDVKSTAERRIFEWFENAPKTDDWIVLHSLGISNHDKVLYGEVDFFVLVPHCGMFALEVKGGRVSRNQGVWYFTDKYGKTNKKSRGPFDQAKEGAFSISKSICPRLDYNHSHLAKVFFGFGVMFPDIEYDANGIDEEQWQVFDSRNQNRVREFVLNLAKESRKKWEQKNGPLNEQRLPSKEDVRYIASVLRGDFDCMISISSQILNAEQSLIRLTNEQYRCLDQIEDNPRALIQGPAGTGKTLLAIEEAKRSAAKGLRVALFCYNSNLAEWLKAYFALLSADICPLFVGTLHSYMMQVIKAGGSTRCVPSSSEEADRFFSEELPQLASEMVVEKFDKVVVDEAQDLITFDYLCLLDSCLLRGLTRGKWTLFGDFSRQAIYSDSASADTLTSMLEEYSSFIRFKLTVNCRNTKQICKVIEVATGFDAPSELWTKVDGPPVNFLTYQSQEEQKEKLIKLLDDLSNRQIDSQQITVLSPVKREASIVSDIEKTRIQDYVVGKVNKVSFSTIQGFKGLENTVIIITDVSGYQLQQLMYVGLSRARSGLYILETRDAYNEYNALLKRRYLNE